MSKRKPTKPSSESGAESANGAAIPCKKPLKTGLGDDVDKEIIKCPKFEENMRFLQNNGWSIEYGEKDKGSYCNRNAKKIVIDKNQEGKTSSILETLAHESGHAMYTPDPYVEPDGLTKEAYASKNANRSLKDEGEATLVNIEMKDCLKKNGGMKIGVAGTQASKYQKVAEKYPSSKDRDKARQEIADIFADNEHPSTDPGKTYRQYYEKPFNDFYDKLANEKTTVKNK
ncbi:MAG: hypothetical protein JNM60_12620 [Candidatus Competibacteraceae bacterium]|nr:hypothetical protein [Candidatus Competibacteraceae bacterium]